MQTGISTKRCLFYKMFKIPFTGLDCYFLPAAVPVPARRRVLILPCCGRWQFCRSQGHSGDRIISAYAQRDGNSVLSVERGGLSRPCTRAEERRVAGLLRKRRFVTARCRERVHPSARARGLYRRRLAHSQERHADRGSSRRCGNPGTNRSSTVSICAFADL